MAEIFVDSLYDSVLDCLKVIPILCLAYLLVSFLSHDHSHKFSKFLSKNKKTSVLYASFLGCVPQCGFSSVIADFYSEKHVSLGTLVAVFVATSDEAIPIMLAKPDRIVDMLILIGLKVLLALFWGYLIDVAIWAFSKKNKLEKKNGFAPEEKQTSSHNEKECHVEHGNVVEDQKECKTDCDDDHMSEGLHHHHECGHIHGTHCAEECGHDHDKCCVNNVFLDAFLHTFNIVIYIFVATFVINMIIGYCGTDALASVLTANKYLQVVLASLIGLIPNCASSVLLVELFCFGSLSFPALLAGLCSGAGVGMIILFTRNRKRPLHNLGILLLQYCIGVASGMFLSIFF